MEQVQKSITVDVPVQVAYNQWTQFEEFPEFMEGVEQVEQLTDDRLHWVAEVGGKKEEWNAVITQQVPDEVIAWKNEDDSSAQNAGMVSFSRDGDKTIVNLWLSYEPKGFKEELGDKLGFLDRQVAADLDRFKEFIEKRGHETGGWRGSIDKDSRVN